MRKHLLTLTCGAVAGMFINVAAAQEAAPAAPSDIDAAVQDSGTGPDTTQGPVAQQDAATTPAAAASDDVAEVIVTAQKRSERLIDVPMSVTAVSADQLAQAGVTSTGDLQQVVPGLTTVNNGLGFVPVIRGVSSQGTSPGDESNVSIYLDDVYVGAPFAGLFDLADIERVEVLKGPQGTLFGRNATGGAIRVVTRKPSFTPEAQADVDYGFRFNEWNAKAYASGPLSDKVAASLSGTYRKGDGYIDGIGPIDQGRNYGAPDNYVVRGKLLFKPSDNLDVTLAADDQKTRNDVVETVWPPKGSDPYPGVGNTPSQPFKYAGSTQPKQRVEGDSVSLDANWQASDALSIRSITAYRDFRLNFQSDIDRTSDAMVALGLTQYQKNFSQELNFSGTQGEFNWLGGLYYYDAKAGNPHWTVYSGDAPDGTPISSFTSEVDTTSWAGFGELTWNTTERLHLTLGGRYTSEKKDYSYRTLLDSSIDKSDDHTWRSPTFRGVARYDVAHDANVYVSVSNGFKSGVYDAYSSIGIPVDPEKVVAVEVGSKARVGRVMLTAAAYNYDYKDIQVSSFATVDGAVVLFLQNAASATMRGLEFTADGPITKHLSFGTGFNWQPIAKFDHFDNAQVTRPIPDATGPIVAEVVPGFDASGSRIPRTPKWTGNARLTYTTPLFNGTFEGNASAFISPGFYWQAGNLTKESAYQTVGLTLSWTDPAGHFTYSVWGHNLTDADNNIYRVPNVRGDSLVAAEPLAGRRWRVGAVLTQEKTNVKVNLGVFAHNAQDWARIQSGAFDRPPETPDWQGVQAGIEIGNLAEPLGFDGIWAPEHRGSPYGMTPNPLQTLTYFAGRTERVTFGTMVAVAPWWHPIRLAHEIAYLDIVSNGRYTTIGLGRGVAKSEFDALGIPREESRQRFNETLDILKLAFTQERFSYDGEIFKIPETSIRPAPLSSDLHLRIHGSSATRDSLEILARKGVVPLFVGNKPIEDAGKEVQLVNTFRREEGFAPCQPKNVLFMYCVPTAGDAAKADAWIRQANVDVNLHYGFADASNFKGIKGYEAYAEREGSATAILAAATTGKDAKPKAPGYHESNLMIGTPDEIVQRIIAAQQACSFSEITIVSHFGDMPHDEALRSTKLFAQEVLPVVQKLDAKLHAAALPETAET